jgi:two-component sensor histidine kinase
VRIERNLPPSPIAPGLARRALKGRLERAVGPETAADILVATSELITNAVRHGNLTSGDAIGLTVEVGDYAVHVAVEQSSPAEDVHVVESLERGFSGGFGLVLVDRLATRWGANPGPPGRVWFEVERSD